MVLPMRFAEDNPAAQYHIRAYAPGQITVNDEALTRSLIITPDRLIRDWPPQSLDELCFDHVQAAIASRPDILILGTGAQMRFPSPALIGEVQALGIGIEVMDTAAACRTYTVLVAEQRRVTAALLIA